MPQNTPLPNTPLAPLAADLPPTCNDLDCTELATHSYTWEWGTSGHVCQTHAPLLAQKAESLGRKVSVSPLQRPPAKPMLRDERTRLTAQALVLNEELEEAKGRGLELYRENVELVKQVQMMSVRAREADAQLSDLQAKLADKQRQLDARDAEHGELVDELTRLRTIAKFAEQSPPVG